VLARATGAARGAVWSRGHEAVERYEGIYKAPGSFASSTKHLARPCCNHHCSSTSNFRALTCASRFLTCRAHIVARHCKLLHARTSRGWHTAKWGKVLGMHQDDLVTDKMELARHSAEGRSYCSWGGMQRQPS